MNLRRSLVVLAGFLLGGHGILAQIPPADSLRGWTTNEGQTFEASIVSFDGTTVSFKARNGQRSPLPAARLVLQDREHLAQWLKDQPIKVVMPEMVGVDSATLKVEVIEEDERNEKFVYRTPHFEFESQGKFTQGLLREVGRNFEATYELLKALPWAIDPKPPSGEFFQARLLRTQSAYEAEGAPKNSGGVFMRRRELFLVPFQSIGLKIVGKSYAKDDDFDTHTLVHELTHQMMHAWLVYLPQWIIEGTAEYTGVLPLKAGRFRVSAAKTGLKAYVDHLKKSRGSLPQPYSLEELFEMTNERWNQILAQNPLESATLYYTSYLLVYYFMNLDGNGDGQLFVRYFREMEATRHEVENYLQAIEEFKKQPGVEVVADGSFRWKGDLKAPVPPVFLTSPEAQEAFQKKTLQILLNGRTEADLMKEIRSAYARLGVRL